METTDRLHALDAVRAFALLLGVAFHAGFSFLPGMIPGLWAIVDNSPSSSLSVLLFTSHIFRMSLFFFVAGFFARMLYHRKGARGFWLDRSKRIGVPLVAGWLLLAPSIIALWIWGMRRAFGETLPAAGEGMPAPPPGAFPLTHLWFLYYLLILYVAVAAVRGVVTLLDRRGALKQSADLLVRGLVRSGGAAAVLPIPLIAALGFRSDWVIWFGIPTPDQSIIPQLASLVAYGTAVAFGWLIHRQRELLEIWARQWKIHLPVALTVTAVLIAIAGVTPSLLPQPDGAMKLAFAALYGVAIWNWCFAIVGLAMQLLSRPSRSIRYVSDASYWIYLAHLPVVVFFQIVLAQLPLHWSLKFPAIVTASLLVLLVSYHYLVRSSFIGQTLNGRRLPRRIVPGTADPAPPSDSESPLTAVRPSSVASLERVQKRYGTTVALDGLDLDVHRGELLAVLGPNGAGKSTAIALWLGLLEPDAGTAKLLGGSPLEAENRRGAGVMLQDVNLPLELRVRELIALTASYYPDPLTTGQALALTGTEALADRPYGKLSTGQKRQVQFALAVCGRPRLLFLDEPTVGLDIEARETIWRAIRSLVAGGCSIVLTTHYLEEAETLADRVVVLAGGRLIASGTVDEIRSIVARREISCMSELPITEVKQWPGVVAVSRDATTLRITVVEAEDVLRRLLAGDETVRNIEVRQAGLAAAFAQLTKEAA